MEFGLIRIARDERAAKGGEIVGIKRPVSLVQLATLFVTNFVHAE